VTPWPLPLLDGHRDTLGFMVDKVLAKRGQCDLDGPEGRLGQLPLALLAALATVRVEDSTTLQVQVARLQPQHLTAPTSSESQGQDDGPVPQSHRRIRYHRQQPLDVLTTQAPGRRRRGLGSLQLVTGLGGHQSHADEELVEAAETGDAGSYGDRGGLSAGSPNLWA
jgi:hypothetical protein